MSYENRYSVPEKWLHRIGFSTGAVQLNVSDIEDRLYAKQLEGIVVKQPVFITALPRAGTTILLNLLVKTGEFATHTYRDMPFVLCPMLWQKFSSRFQQDDAPRERAHGDGLSISLQSPEAFEEIIWRLFWKDHYRDSHIEPWTDCGDDEFLDFFTRHMRKIIALRNQGGEPGRRYASKNNGNIARLDILQDIFPDATVIIPFRDPLDHAASLLNQHQRFLAMHSEDRFSARYMEGIGHYDFGDNLKPVNFDDWIESDRRPDATGLGFWLEYWIAAYRYILGRQSDTVHLLSYANLISKPHESLARLAEVLELRDPDALVDQAGELRPAREHSIDTSALDPKMLLHANEINQKLQDNSIRID